MPDTFNLSDIVRTRTDTPIKKRHISQTKPELTGRERFTQFIKQYSTRVWGGYYTILVISSFLTGVIVERTGLAKNIMDYVRVQQKASTPVHQIADNSSFQLNAGPGMVAVVKFPDGKRVGDSVEGIRYLEVPRISLTQTTVETTQSTTRSWGMTAPQPPNGTYVVDFSAKRAGSYPYTLTAYDRSGITKITRSGEITLNAYEHHIYSLVFNKSSIEAILFDFIKVDPSAF